MADLERKLEVFANSWNNQWRRVGREELPTRVVSLTKRVMENAPVAIISRLFGRLLPGESYLNNLLVLQKKGNATR